MGFYNSKLDNYSKFIELTQDQLYYTKGKIIEQKQKYIDGLKKDMQISRRAGLNEHDFGMYEEEKLEVEKARFIKAFPQFRRDFQVKKKIMAQLDKKQ